MDDLFTGGGLDTTSSSYQDLVDNAGSDGAYGGGLDSASAAAANSYGSTWDSITGAVSNALTGTMDAASDAASGVSDWYGGLSKEGKGLLASSLAGGASALTTAYQKNKDRKAAADLLRQQQAYQSRMSAVPKLN